MPNVVRSLAYILSFSQSPFIYLLKFQWSPAALRRYTHWTLRPEAFLMHPPVSMELTRVFPILLTQKMPHQRCLCNCFYMKGALWNALKFALKLLCLIWSCYIQMPKTSWFCMRKSVLKLHHPHESLLQSSSSINLISFFLQWRERFSLLQRFLVFTTSFSRNYEKSFSLLRKKFFVITTFFLVITTFFS